MCTCLPPYLTSYAGWLERGSQWHCLYLHKFPALLPISAAAILLRDKHLLSEQKGKKRRFLLMISSDKLMTDKIQDHLEHMCISYLHFMKHCCCQKGTETFEQPSASSWRQQWQENVYYLTLKRGNHVKKPSAGSQYLKFIQKVAVFPNAFK